MDKKRELEKLESEMKADKTLPLRRANLVFGEWNINCRVLFIGEAPGAKEDELERPFVGRSGQLLDKSLGKIGWKRGEVYITNIVKRRPPENRDPSLKEIEAYKPYLTKQIEMINPKVIVTLGRFSMNYFLPEAKISEDQGRVSEIGGRLLMPMFHPAAVLRGTVKIKDFEKTFRKLPKLIVD